MSFACPLCSGTMRSRTSVFALWPLPYRSRANASVADPTRASASGQLTPLLSRAMIV